MSKVKLISNPYMKENKILIEVGNDWQPIIESSELNTERFKSGFFPFIITDILSILTVEIRDVDCIVFEGTEDDYKILYDIILNDYKGIDLIKENTYLNSANDVLSKIKEIFENSYSIIVESVGDNEYKIKKVVDKFIDASNDKIPLCIVGNYSSGKSTFINSLIGMDILPCGSKVLTQNICKIVKSKHKINSYIRFENNNQKYEITYSNNDYEITNGEINNGLMIEIEQELRKVDTANLSKNINKTLEIINKHNDIVTEVEIEVPFSEGVLSKIDKKIVIFDTPGSDTATFKKHKEILKNELNEITNGMLVFVVEKLDNDSNEELYNMIKEIKELDIRFTMIVMNKADNMELPERGYYTDDEKEEIMSYSVPRHLYSNGLYYLSSIMGLGSKTGGQFISKFNKERYIKEKDNYLNNESEFYVELYKYDIMPQHKMKQMFNDANNETNKIYLNSGLYSIENEIGIFATEYSSYNKCKQSKLFFEKIISITSNEIENNKVINEKDKQDINKLLNQETCKLMEEVRQKKSVMFDTFRDLYIKDMQIQNQEMIDNSSYDIKKMIELEKSIRNDNEIKYGIRNEKLKSSNKIENVSKVLTKDWEEFKSSPFDTKLKKTPDLILHGLDIFKTKLDNAKNEYNLHNKIKNATSEELFERVKKEYDENVHFYKTEIGNLSRTYCEIKAKIMKEDLLRYINGNPELNEKQKECLASVIANYKDIVIGNNADCIFIKSELKKLPKILSGFTNELDSNKLSERYNNAIRDCIIEIFEKFQKNNFATIDDWFTRLINEIKNKIVSLNPQLSMRAEKIKLIDDKISKLIKNKQELTNYLERIDDLISWKS